MKIPESKGNVSRRVSATLVDYIIITAFFVWFVMTFGEPDDEGGKMVSGMPALIPVGFWFTWLVLPETFFGATLGHLLLGLKVISFDGSGIRFSQSVKRRLCDAIEISWCFGLMAYVLIKNTEHGQRLGDIWARTLVINLKEESEVRFDFETSENENKK